MPNHHSPIPDEERRKIGSRASQENWKTSKDPNTSRLSIKHGTVFDAWNGVPLYLKTNTISHHGGTVQHHKDTLPPATDTPGDTMKSSPRKRIAWSYGPKKAFSKRAIGWTCAANMVSPKTTNDTVKPCLSHPTKPNGCKILVRVSESHNGVTIFDKTKPATDWSKNGIGYPSNDLFCPQSKVKHWQLQTPLTNLRPRLQQPNHCRRPQTTIEDIRSLDQISNTRLKKRPYDTGSKWPQIHSQDTHPRWSAYKMAPLPTN